MRIFFNTEPELSYDDIIKDILGWDVEDSKDEELEQEFDRPKVNIREALEIKKRYMLFSEKGSEIKRSFNVINSIVLKEAPNKLKPKKLDEYFKMNYFYCKHTSFVLKLSV